MGIEDIKNFFKNIEKLSFFERLFNWKKTKENFLLVYDEIKNLENQIKKIENLENEINHKEEIIDYNQKNIEEQKIKIKESELKIEQFNHKNSENEKKISQLEESLNSLKSKNIESNSEIQFLKEKIENLLNENKNLDKKINQFEQIKEEQQKKYDEMILRSNAKEETYEKRRLELEENEKNKETLRFEEMKKTWKNHEDDVERRIREICQINIVEYVDKENFPYSGKPDNCIKIAGEYIIFDAKSPRDDNLNNFPKYIKDQTEKINKYIKFENVKRDLFLIVPNNTIDKIEKTHYNMSEYDVYIITKDSIEPIILSLKKIETYDMADKLDPADRDRICRVIGRFAHSTKRRLQIDNFFAHEYISLLENCEILPDEILEKSIDYEKGSILNPTIEKRAKLIELNKLDKETKKVQKSLEIYNLNTNIKGNDIEKIELYNEDQSNESLDEFSKESSDS